MKIGVPLVFFTILAIAAQPALADADLCKDVLINGTMQRIEIRNHTFFQQALASSSDKKTEEKDDKKKGAEATIPYGDMIFGGKYNESDAHSYFGELHNRFDLTTTFNERYSALLSIGDPAIVDAWSHCMGKARGLSMRFVANSPTAVSLYIEWYAYPVAPGVPTSTTLIEDIVIPENLVKQGQPCLRASHVLEDRNPCVVRLEFPNGEKDLLVTANTLHGPAEAYLPKRRILVAERSAWIPQPKDKWQLGVTSYDAHTNGPTECVVPPAGWKFVAASAMTTGTFIKNSPTTESYRCLGKFTEGHPTPGQICWYPRVMPGATGDNSCLVTLTAEVIRWKEVDGLQYR